MNIKCATSRNAQFLRRELRNLFHIPVLVEQEGEVAEVGGAEEHLGLFQHHGDVGVVDAVVLIPADDVASGGRKVPAAQGN